MKRFVLLALLALAACDSAEVADRTASVEHAPVASTISGTYKGADVDGYFVIDIPEIPPPDASGTSVAHGYGVMADSQWPPGGFGCDPYCPIRVRVEVSGQTNRAPAQVNFQIESAITQGHWIAATGPVTVGSALRVVWEYGDGRLRPMTLTKVG